MLLNQLDLFSGPPKAPPKAMSQSSIDIQAPDEYDFMGMKIIDNDWQQEKESGLKCKMLAGIKTKLHTQGCHLFEISNGEFSVALEFKQFPTYYGAIRAAIPTFIELRYLNPQGNPVCAH